ncbi:Hypothetical protein PBC10988_9860 [Planctomycetales bacterium 10988]|nr:Hypothetical protein PBC10988_9860 [Planctomycetales bacterium 10988]
MHSDHLPDSDHDAFPPDPQAEAFRGQDNPFDPAFEENPEGTRGGSTGLFAMTVLAWIVILGWTIFVFSLTNLAPKEQNPKASQKVVDLPTRILQIQGKYLVATKSIVPTGFEEQVENDIEANLSTLNTGTVNQRLRFIVLSGELQGPQEAMTTLQDLEARLSRNQDVEVTEEQQQLLATLQLLYQDYLQEKWNAPQLSKKQRQRLTQDLGWFGDLALAPVDGENMSLRAKVLMEARQVFGVIILGVGGLFLLGGIGVIALIVLGILSLRGTQLAKVFPKSPPGGIYAETFALWLTIFLIANLSAGWLGIARLGMWVQGVIMIGSMSALVWPCIRGLSWKQVRQDMGLQFGKSPVLTLLGGPGCYSISLPILGIGILITLQLAQWSAGMQPVKQPGDNFSPVQGPSHPIVLQFDNITTLGFLQVFFLAAIAAPITEEIMFRGVLYRHLREAFAPLATGIGIFLSVMISSLIFASVHPQGWIAIPALSGLAIGFALTREMTDSIIPSMIAHAIHNGMLTLVMLIIF